MCICAQYSLPHHHHYHRHHHLTETFRSNTAHGHALEISHQKQLKQTTKNSLISRWNIQRQATAAQFYREPHRNVCLLIKYLNWICSLLFRSLAVPGEWVWVCGSVSFRAKLTIRGNIESVSNWYQQFPYHGPIRVNWQTTKRKHISCMRGHYAASEKENAIYVSLAENCCLKWFSLEPFGLWMQTTCFFPAATADFLSLFFHFCFYLLIFKRYFSDHLFRHWAQQKILNIFITSILPFSIGLRLYCRHSCRMVTRCRRSHDGCSKKRRIYWVSKVLIPLRCLENSNWISIPANKSGDPAWSTAPF